MFNLIMFFICLGSFIVLVIRLYGSITYSQDQAYIDSLGNGVKIFPIFWPFVLFLVSFVWLVFTFEI